MMESFYPFYRPLNQSRQEIRLLEIISTPTPHDPVQPLPSVECKLHVVPLLENPTFTALSYVWGNPQNTEEIEVDGIKIPVTVNLASALKYVRGHWQNQCLDQDVSSFRIWADAVCINQLDLDERSHQVTLMRTLYRNAEMVFCWLGVGNDEISDDGIDIAMGVLATIAIAVDTDGEQSLNLEWVNEYPELSDWDTSTPERALESSWMTVLRFPSLEYWQRVWIFQEITLARDAFLIHKWASIHYSVVDVAYRFLDTLRLNFTTEAPKPHESIKNALRKWLMVSYQNWNVFRMIKRAKLRFVDHNASTQSSRNFDERSFEIFMTVASSLRCSDVRDHVYGFLGVMDVGIVPDYRKSILSVLQDLCLAWMNKTNRLNFLSHAGLGLSISQDFNIPSWAPQLEELSEYSGSLIYHTTSRADQNVFDSNANASLHGNILSVTALTGPTISRIHPEIDITSVGRLASDLFSRYPNGISGEHPYKALTRVITRDHLSEIEFLRQIWAILLALDLRPHTPHELRQKYSMASEILAQEAIKYRPSLTASDRKEASDCPPPDETIISDFSYAEMNQLAVELSNHAQLYRFIETDDGHLGLALKTSQVGDVLTVVHGYSMPLVMRKIESHYVNIGGCHMAGLMYGEAVKWRENGKSGPERIDIW